MTVDMVRHAAPARGERVFRSAIARTVKTATPAIKEAFTVAFVLAGLLAVMTALVALDVWIWVPRFNH